MGYIYKIVNTVNNKIYIGKTTRTLQERFAEHIRHAENHENRYLYSAMNCYGYDAFIIEEIIEADNEALNELESYYISLFRSNNSEFGYNMTSGGDGVPELSPEVESIRAAKISAALKDRPQPPELVKKRAKKLRGKKRSIEARLKMSEAHKGKTAWNKGITMTEETKQKLREANIGKKQSDVTKLKRSEKISKLMWYNNGIRSIRATECPKGFVPGRINFKPSAEAKARSSHKGTHWYTNGVTNVMSYECPEGFWPGKTKRMEGEKEFMHYIKVLKNCVSDGPGIRVSLYVSGCRNHCAECHNPQSWNFNFGHEFNENTVRDILESLSRPYIKGLTLCGGDPLEPENQKALLPLVKEIKQKLPDKDIWCYTGYEWEQIKGFEILKYIDVAIVGPFIKELRDITLNNIWRGSRNQRLIDVQSSLKQNTKIFVENIINNE